MRILLTSSSFQSIEGRHTEVLKKMNFEIEIIQGPLKEDDLLPIIDRYDGILMGDDEYTGKVLKKGARSKLRVLSKYGTGLDKIDLDAAKKLGISVCNVVGVNKTTVAEHVFALLLSFIKNIPQEVTYVKMGKWKRLVAFELREKRLGIVGLGKIGKEVAKIALAFGMKIKAWDQKIDFEYCEQYGIKVTESLIDVFKTSDIITLHLPLTKETKGIINKDILKYSVDNLIIINTARGALVNEIDLKEKLQKNLHSGYLADVLDKEPIHESCLLHKLPNVFITPHIASRTRENIERQGLEAVNNLIMALKSR